MTRTPSAAWMTPDRERQLTADIARERPRLRNFIRSRVADANEVEDILQDVFAELVESYRALRPVEQVGAWLATVARNRITDLFRKKKPVGLDDLRSVDAGHDSDATVEDLLPSPEAGPEAAYARSVLLEELENALQELPQAQREVFIAHEIDGRSFRELAAETGLNLNTLLARKRYAVLHLRRRLQAVYEDFFETGGWDT
jgi:RNA polymerase sigma factor (sigma-70 family)